MNHNPRRPDCRHTAPRRCLATITGPAGDPTPNEHDAIFDETAGGWISRAEVSEVPFIASLRRIPDVCAEVKKAAGQYTLFDVWRFHLHHRPADSLDTLAADRARRVHAIIEQFHPTCRAIHST